MAVHPFKGLQLPLVRLERDWYSGRRFAVVEHPKPELGHLRLPVEWTDRATGLIPVRVGDRDAKLGVAGLQKLARGCSAARTAAHQALDGSATSEQTSSPRPEQASSHAFSPDALGGAIGDGPDECARRVGEPRAQGSTRSESGGGR